MENKTVDTLIPADWKPEAEDVAEFIEGLSEEDREHLLSFIQGAKFVLSLKKAM